MESIKEEVLNLQREVVTTTPNTWLVEAVNPTTGEKKMINVSNFSSVVAGLNGITRQVISLPIGETIKLTSIPEVCTVIISEGIAKISGVILKRLTETSLVKGDYLSASSSGTTALIVYSESRLSLTLKNNHTTNMSIAITCIA